MFRIPSTSVKTEFKKEQNDLLVYHILLSFGHNDKKWGLWISLYENVQEMKKGGMPCKFIEVVEKKTGVTGKWSLSGPIKSDQLLKITANDTSVIIIPINEQTLFKVAEAIRERHIASENWPISALNRLKEKGYITDNISKKTDDAIGMIKSIHEGYFKQTKAYRENSQQIIDVAHL